MALNCVHLFSDHVLVSRVSADKPTGNLDSQLLQLRFKFDVLRLFLRRKQVVHEVYLEEGDVFGLIYTVKVLGHRHVETELICAKWHFLQVSLGFESFTQILLDLGEELLHNRLI